MPKTRASDRTALSLISSGVFPASFQALGPPDHPTSMGVSSGYVVHQTGKGSGSSDCTKVMSLNCPPQWRFENRDDVQNGASNRIAILKTPPITRPCTAESTEGTAGSNRTAPRSEERRVGKECGSGCSAS